MRPNNHLLTVGILVIASLLLSACTPTPTVEEETKPVHLEPIEGTDFNLVTLTEKAAERLGIQTAQVREEQVTRTRTVGGEVVALPEGEVAKPSKVWVRVLLNESDLNQVARGQPAIVLPLDDDEEDSDEAEGLTAEADEGPADDDSEEAASALYYVLDNVEHSLAAGQRVLVELLLSGSETPRKVVPYAAVIYGPNGETWVFISPEPLVFVRQPVSVDYIEDELAVLSEGPPAGMAVVTVGAAELYGSEFEFEEE